MKKSNVVRTIYLYLVTVVGIVMALTGLIGAITSILNIYVFRLVMPENMQSELSMLLEFASAVAVGVPVWLYHWGIIQETRRHAPALATAGSEVTSETPTTVAPMPQPEGHRDLIRRLYIYLLSAIGLFIVMSNLINVVPGIYRAFFMLPDTMMLPAKPDTTGLVSIANEYAIKSLIENIVAVLVGAPVWLYHWHLGQREHRDVFGE